MESRARAAISSAFPADSLTYARTRPSAQPLGPRGSAAATPPATTGGCRRARNQAKELMNASSSGSWTEDCARQAPENRSPWRGALSAVPAPWRAPPVQATGRVVGNGARNRMSEPAVGLSGKLRHLCRFRVAERHPGINLPVVAEESDGQDRCRRRVGDALNPVIDALRRKWFGGLRLCPA